MDWSFRSPLGTAAIGVGTTLVLALIVVIALSLAGGASSISANAALIGALIALGGVFTTQMVNSVLEDRRARAAALQAYLDRIGNLLAEEGVLHTDEGTSTLAPKASVLVRAQTLAVLEGLDPPRKRVVLQFLRESDLIPCKIEGQRDKIVDLSGANLRDAELSGLNLREAALDGAFLERANLRKAYLPCADLGGSWLHGADLTDAKLIGASLINARLHYRPDASPKAVNLSGADLTHADLSGALLRGANMIGANLKDAKGLTQEQVNQAYGSSQWGDDMPDTELPDDLNTPEAWRRPLEEQKGQRQKSRSL
jgi:hypothetical protein